MRQYIKGSRRSSAFLFAVLALVAAAAGTAVAGPHATTSAISKKKVKKIAAKQAEKVVDARAAELSVAHADTATDATNAENATRATSATRANSAVSADSAKSVGGVSITPVSFAVPEGSPGVTMMSVNGSLAELSNCGSGEISFRVGRTSSSSPPITQRLTVSGAATENSIPPGNFFSNNDPALGLTATIYESSGRVTRLTVDGFYEQNAFGGADDCFARGTIERFG